MLYASTTLSLACLEILVHIKEPRFPFDYEWVKIEIPAGLIDRPFPLPDSDDGDLQRQLGSSWIREAVVKLCRFAGRTVSRFLNNPFAPPADKGYG